MSFDLNQSETSGKKVIIQYSASGNTANKSTFDDQPKGFVYADTSSSVMTFYVKTANTSASWSNPFNYQSLVDAMSISVYDANVDGKIDLAAGGTGVSASSNQDLLDKIGVTSAISALGTPVILKGSWDASTGSFPANTKNGWTYIVSSNGTINSVNFTQNDRLLSLANNASTSTYVGNWLKLDYTDQVLSVAGLQGAITANNLADQLITLMPKAGGTFTGDVSHSVGSYPLNITTTTPASTSHSLRHNVTDLFLNSVRGLYLNYDYGAGVVVGAATGGIPSAGKINAVDYLINGTSIVSTFVSNSTYTGSDILTKLKTVDGTGSGLDADLLDGQQGAYYQQNLLDVGAIELGASGTGDRSAYIDFHADDTNTDNSFRILRNSGVNGTAVISNVGTGSFTLSTNGLAAFTLSSTGTASLAYGLAFGSQTGSSPQDLSKHISLYGANGYGFSVTGSSLNIVAGGSAAVNFYSGVTNIASISATGVMTAGGNAVLDVDTDHQLTAGFATAYVSDGAKSSGTYTPTWVGGNMRYITNGGAFTLAAPTAAGDYTIIIRVDNTSGAGAITMSGFVKVSGDSFTTTVGNRFFISIIKFADTSSATVQALQ